MNKYFWATTMILLTIGFGVATLYQLVIARDLTWTCAPIGNPREAAADAERKKAGLPDAAWTSVERAREVRACDFITPNENTWKLVEQRVSVDASQMCCAWRSP